METERHRPVWMCVHVWSRSMGIFRDCWQAWKCHSYILLQDRLSCVTQLIPLAHTHTHTPDYIYAGKVIFYIAVHRVHLLTWCSMEKNWPRAHEMTELRPKCSYRFRREETEESNCLSVQCVCADLQTGPLCIPDRLLCLCVCVCVCWCPKQQSILLKSTHSCLAMRQSSNVLVNKNHTHLSPLLPPCSLSYYLSLSFLSAVKL